MADAGTLHGIEQGEAMLDRRVVAREHEDEIHPGASPPQTNAKPPPWGKGVGPAIAALFLIVFGTYISALITGVGV